jgi:uncharacterized protein (TIGR00730 family)
MTTRKEAEALERRAEITQHPSYTPGDQDVEFLDRADTRGLRLQLDYLKAELLLRDAGIEHSIVVFGSTQIVEPTLARQRLAAAQAAAVATPADAELQRRAAVAARIEANSHYYDVARELGRLVAAANRDPLRCDTVVVTGGGPGIMEAANRGAFDMRAPTVGLNIDLPHEQFPNSYVTPGLCFRFHYFAMRKLHFLRRARALVAFPGGFGTIDELFETLTLLQTRKIAPLPVVLVGESYWRRAIDIPFMVGEGMIQAADAQLFTYAEAAPLIWRSIVDWHHHHGAGLFGGGAG